MRCPRSLAAKLRAECALTGLSRIARPCLPGPATCMYVSWVARSPARATDKPVAPSRPIIKLRPLRSRRRSPLGRERTHRTEDENSKQTPTAFRRKALIKESSSLSRWTIFGRPFVGLCSCRDHLDLGDHPADRSSCSYPAPVGSVGHPVCGRRLVGVSSVRTYRTD